MRLNSLAKRESNLTPSSTFLLLLVWLKRYLMMIGMVVFMNTDIVFSPKFPGVLAYNVSKAAVDQFTRSVALDLAPKKVRVNCVNPGVVITELQKRGGLSEEQYAAFLERSKTTHALGRPGDAHEVASAIAFLASEEASFVTGVSLPVDGGRHAMCPR